MKNTFIGYDFRADRHAAARIWTRVAAAKPAGLPSDGRVILLDGTERSCRLRRPMQWSFALRRDPQPSFTPQVRPPARKARAAPLANPWGRSDERGCIGRLRARLSAKLLRIPPPQAGYSIFSVPSKMPSRTSPGQPTVLAAAAISRIRAGARTSAQESSPIQFVFLSVCRGLKTDSKTLSTYED